MPGAAPTPRLPPLASARSALASFLFAVQFLTVLPVPGLKAVDARAFSASVGYFPLVGALLGCGLASLDQLLRAAFPPGVNDAVLIAVLVTSTGALHLDGVADTCDALFAPGRDRAARLGIMREVGLGAFGVLGVMGVVLAKYSALGSLPDAGRGAALVGALALGRWAIVYCYAVHPYARSSQSASALLKRGATPTALLAGTATTLVASLALGPAGALLFLLVGAVTAGVARLAARRLNGITGDVCGAACELSETLALLLVPAVGRLAA